MEIYGDFDKNKMTSIELVGSERDYLKEIAMGKLVLAVKENDGTYRAVTKPAAISNPEVLAPPVRMVTISIGRYCDFILSL